MTSRIITLTTDFGTSDGYVAQMKGVILGISSNATIVDVSHDIRPQDVSQAAFVIDQTVDAFPPGTVHVVVVDPGVGSDRRVIAVEAGSQRFVAPDNGVLSRVLRRLRPQNAVVLTERRYWRPAVSTTFHGRDIMAPVAAHWSLGVEVSQFGNPPADPLFVLPERETWREGSALVGEIVAIDHFGNLMTNIDAGELPQETASQLQFEIGSQTVQGLCRCYADVPDGSLAALVGSHGRLEFAVNRGSAAERLSVGVGQQVRVKGFSESGMR